MVENDDAEWTDGGVWNANTQWTTSHVWDNVHKLDAEAQKHRSIYHHTQSALQWLDIGSDYLETLSNIADDDIKVAGDITDENRFGQWSDTIPCFGRLGSLLVQVAHGCKNVGGPVF